MLEWVIRNKRMKAGVSLVTVLLFMLVATIAATATYKWLTSEGRSSGARLQKQEAYQSAMAGIENTRAWMTFNANDVGALIKQYKDSGKKIKLNSRLLPWSSSNHNYDVWLAGVNTGAAHNFKLKVVSSGKSSQGTVHNEIAIFNVDGLYQVQIPSEEVGGATFDKAFDGKTTGLTGNDTLQSGIIHGDFKDQNNTPKLSGNFIISGDMGFGGHIHGNGDMYVKGSLTSTNGGYTFGNDLKSTGWGWMGWGVTDLPDTNVVYIGGDVDCADNQPIRVYGDLYVGGKIKERCAIEVTGNLTIGGGIDRTTTAAKMFTIGKNLVFKKDAVFKYTTTIEYGTGGTAGEGVGENTYLAGLEGKSSNGGRKINFGKQIYLYDNVAGYTYCANKDRYGYGGMPGSFRPYNCTYCEGFFSACDGDGHGASKEEDRYFSIYNPLIYSGYGYYATYTYNSRVSDTRISEWSKDDAVLKDVNSNYWDKIEKMQGYGKIIKNDGTIPQAMLLKDSTEWIAKAKANVANCKDITVAWKTEPKDIKALNDCYKDAKTNHPDWLYGGFLPIEWQYAEDKDPGREKLEGNFLIYASKAVGNTTLPPTTATSIVMFYFEKGVNGQLKGKHDDRLNRDLVYNYFIYSNGDIKEIHGFNIKGSIVMSNGTTLQKYQGGNKAEFSSTVINALVNAGIIKENPEFTRLVNGSSSSSGSGEGSTSTTTGGGTDPYYIAASPQLRVTLESQYENNEPLPVAEEEAEPEPAFMVLPRIIYLPKNPYGKLTDYFNVVSLNGAEVTKDAAKISGCSDIPKLSLLYDRGNAEAATLAPGIHKCTYDELSKSIPFYVFIYDSDIGTLPLVQFETDYEELGVGEAKQVKMVCPAGQSSQEFKIKVTKPNDLPSSWTITRHEGATLDGPGGCSASDAECTFKFNFSTDCGDPKPLFDISTTATEGTAVFQMVCTEGCLTGSPSTEKFIAASSVTINREDLKAYCALSGVTCDEEMIAKANRPDCRTDGTKSWVKAVGSGATTSSCTITDPNESWTCGVSSTIQLSNADLETNVPAGCEVIIPTDETHNKISSPTPSETYTLYASLKAQIYDFTVGFAGNELAGKVIEVRSERFTDGKQTCSYSASNPSCTYQLYAGDKVEVVVPASGRSDFNYWKCTPGTGNVNCPTSEPMTGATYTIEEISGPNSVTAWFGQKDKHCFFDEFNTSKVCGEHTAVGDKMYCFSYCVGTSCTIANAFANTAGEVAKWFVFGGADERNNLQYEDGKIWLNDTYVRGKKQSDVTPLKILSTREAGLYGTLRAQFQIPQLGRGGNESSAKVNNSGFILRSDNAASEYVMLNVFANRNGKLAAKVCIADACREDDLTSSIGTVSVSSTDVITLSATIKAEGNKDILEVEAVLGNYGSYTTASTRFELTGIEGYAGLTTRGVNEYVGFSLSDPAFQLYDIGWKSEDYNAQCWDTYPTVKCSFRVAYVGGIVPLGKTAKPWVGLSSWFDDKDCTPKYYYNGNDATSGCYGTESDGYKECHNPDFYNFSGDGASGLHGTSVDGVETKMAMARVQNCDAAYLSDDARQSLYAEAPRCGEFWVGNFNNCNQNVVFFSSNSGRSLSKHTGSSGTNAINAGELFALSSNNVANLRAASIKIILENPNASELEVYLRSITTDGYGYYGAKQVLYSTSATITANGVATISVEDLSNELGFDVEHVDGVVVRNLSDNVVTIKEIRSACDYVTSIQCRNLEYTGGKFKINAVVKQAQNVSGYSIVGKDGNDVTVLSEKMWTCGNDGVDCPTGDNEGKIVLESDAYNPYSEAFDEEKSFVFTVNMYDAPNHHAEGSPCTTSPVLKIQPISAECKWSSTNEKPSIQQGKGLPDFQYKLADCGDKTCAWEIYLDGTKIHEGTGTLAGFTSLPSEVRSGHNQNTDEGKLSVNDHTISIRNAGGDGNAKFNECSKTFAVTEANNSTGNLTCELASTEILKGSTHNKMSIYSTLVNQEFDLYIDDSRVTTYTKWIANGQNNDWGGFTAPATLGPHSFKIVKVGETEAECAGNFTVVNQLTCEAKTDGTFTVTRNSNVNNCYECSCSGTTGSCDAPNPSHTYSFTLPTSGEKTLSISCKCDNVPVTCSDAVAVNLDPPTATCPENNINFGPKEEVSFGTTLTNCATGCNYTITHKGSAMEAGSGTTSASSTTISFTDATARSGENTYTFTVTNGDGGTTSGGSASCEFVVDYKKPSYSCPDAITAEPGAQVTVTPTNVSYCSGGCDYKITGTGIDDIEGENFTSGSLADKIVDASNPITGTDVTGGVAKKYSLTLSNAAGAGTACDVTVNYMKPTVVCPDGMEKAANASVTVTPTSVTNCTQGCKYKVTMGSATGTTVIDEPSTYSYTVATGGTPGSLGSGLTGEDASTDSVRYYVTLSNPAGSATCDFGVMYKSSAELCHCETYCGSGCFGHVKTGNVNDVAFNGCLFITDATRLSFNTDNPVGGYWKVNGNTINTKQPCWDNGTDCSNFLNTYTKVDGGWYITGNVGWASVRTTTATSPCGSGSGGGSGGSGATSLGSVQGVDGAASVDATLTAGTNYTLTLEHRWYNSKLRIGHWSGDPITLTYTNCNGTSTTETFNVWDQWYERDIGLNDHDDCTITISSSTGGSVSFNHW